MTITAVFFDVGGVLGTNGWDRHCRRSVAGELGIDYDEMAERHELVINAFETGQMELSEYLDAVVFHRERPFTPGEFWETMKSKSVPDPAALAVVDAVRQRGHCFLATLNNESHELNDFRIDHFGLRRRFDAFLTSSYLGVKKPDPAIYGLALHITGRVGAESVFIDDRDLNLEAAEEQGMVTIHFRNPDQLRADLVAIGVLD